jgi:hypothetical protein
VYPPFRPLRASPRHSRTPPSRVTPLTFHVQAIRTASAAPARARAPAAQVHAARVRARTRWALRAALFQRTDGAAARAAAIAPHSFPGLILLFAPPRVALPLPRGQLAHALPSSKGRRSLTRAPLAPRLHPLSPSPCSRGQPAHRVVHRAAHRAARRGQRALRRRGAAAPSSPRARAASPWACCPRAPPAACCPRACCPA